MPAAAENLMGVTTRQQKKVGGGRLFSRTPLPRKEIIITNTRVHTTNRLPLGSCSWQRRSGRWHPGPHDAAVPRFSPLQSYMNVRVCVCATVVPTWARSRVGVSALPIELWGTKVCCNVFTIPVGSLVLLSLNDRFPQLLRG